MDGWINGDLEIKIEVGGLEDHRWIRNIHHVIDGWMDTWLAGWLSMDMIEVVGNRWVDREVGRYTDWHVILVRFPFFPFIISLYISSRNSRFRLFLTVGQLSEFSRWSARTSSRGHAPKERWQPPNDGTCWGQAAERPVCSLEILTQVIKIKVQMLEGILYKTYFRMCL